MDVITNDKNDNTFVNIPDSILKGAILNERINQDKKITDFWYELRDLC